MMWQWDIVDVFDTKIKNCFYVLNSLVFIWKILEISIKSDWSLWGLNCKCDVTFLVKTQRQASTFYALAHDRPRATMVAFIF